MATRMMIAAAPNRSRASARRLRWWGSWLQLPFAALRRRPVVRLIVVPSCIDLAPAHDAEVIGGMLSRSRPGKRVAAGLARTSSPVIRADYSASHASTDLGRNAHLQRGGKHIRDPAGDPGRARAA